MQTTTTGWNWRRTADLAEQVVLLGLYGWLVVRLLPDSHAWLDWPRLMLLVSEGVVLAFLIVRRPTDAISTRPRDWLYAFAASFMVLLVERGGEPLHAALGGVLITLGFAVHVGAKLSLRRSFGLVPADRGIMTRGLYVFVRHPMYFGYCLSHIGFLIAAPSFWNLAVYACAWPLFVARILAEEKILSGNPEYRAYREQVRYRLLPGVF